MLKGFEVVYEKIIHEMKHLALKGVVNYVQKRHMNLVSPIFGIVL